VRTLVDAVTGHTYITLLVMTSQNTDLCLFNILPDCSYSVTLIKITQGYTINFFLLGVYFDKSGGFLITELQYIECVTSYSQ
jgi:hypothetical protein